MDFFNQHKKEVFMLDWPKYFGDAMPLERVWLKMSLEFSKCSTKATDEQSLWEQVQLMWSKLCTDEFILKLIQDVPVNFKKIEQCVGRKYVD